MYRISCCPLKGITPILNEINLEKVKVGPELNKAQHTKGPEDV